MTLRRRRPADPLGRTAALGLAAGRLGVGVGAFFATEAALRALGFGATDPSGRTLARMAGARDLALGAVTVAARNDPAALRTATLAGAALDAGDTVAFLRAARDPAMRRAAAGGIASAGFAAVAGLWAARRLG